MSRAFFLIGPAPRRAAQACVGAVILGVGVAGCTSPSTPAPRTATVELATLSMGVTAPGSLTALTEENLGFPTAGQLVAVSVKVGDKVKAGQPLAAIDDFAAKQALATQRAQLATQQATLSRLIDSPMVQGAVASRDKAKDIVSSTRNTVDATRKADDTAVDNAKKQLDTDKDAQDQAEDGLEQCQSSTASLVGQFEAGKQAVGNVFGSGDSSSDDNSSDSSSGGGQLASTICASQQSAVEQAKQRVIADRGAVDTARRRRDVDDAQGKLQIDQAQQSLISAQNNVDSSSSDRPNNINAQAGQVAAARAAVTQAQRNLDDTTLNAPVAGTVSVLNGAVGEYIAPSSGTSSLAPGSGATIPGAGGSTTGGSAAAASAGGATASRPGGSQFLVLDDIDQFQVVAPFNESDAANIKANQKVQVTLDALPDLTEPGTVVSISPTGTSIAGVISYYVTVALTAKDPRLKSGQTASVSVVTSEAPNVLTVPTQAVRKQDGRSVVTVAGPNGAISVPFQPGLVGVDRTEVRSGLKAGQQVLLPVGQ